MVIWGSYKSLWRLTLVPRQRRPSGSVNRFKGGFTGVNMLDDFLDVLHETLWMVFAAQIANEKKCQERKRHD